MNVSFFLLHPFEISSKCQVSHAGRALLLEKNKWIKLPKDCGFLQSVVKKKLFYIRSRGKLTFESLKMVI